MSKRILVIGNSGAGKSSLAGRLSALLKVPAINLDRLHWEDDCYGRKRPEDEARALVKEAASQNAWIIEGVYGWLADVATPRATDLVWLDMPWAVCREGLMARNTSTGRPAEDRQELMAWAAAYWDRDTSSSFLGHARIFASFTARKFRIKSRNGADGLIGHLAGNDQGLGV
jgi:adenylate kinase family enzyme